MARVTTLRPELWPLMKAPSVETPCCAVCGRPAPLERHHVVFRSEGELWRDGRRVPKPTVTLCGFGNVLASPDGRPYCHGLAHHRMLHFRWTGERLEYLRTDSPTKYCRALQMDGWRGLRQW